MTQPLTLAAVMASGIPLVWHEGVALVQEVVQTALRGSGALPDVDAIVLDRAGTIRFLAEGPPGRDQAELAAALLSGLLQGQSAPEDLRKLVAGGADAGNAYASLEDFGRALAFFERPGRQGDVAAVARRASELLAQHDTERQLEQLQAKTRASSRPPRTFGAGRHTSRGLVWAAGVAGLLLTAGIVWAATTWFERPAEALTTPSLVDGEDPYTGVVARARTELMRAIEAGLSALPGDWKPAEADPLEELPEPAPRRPTPPREPASVLAPLSVPNYVLIPEPAPARAVVPSVPEPEPAPTFDTAIYTGGDANVTPPEIVRPALPSEPPPHIAAERIGVLELTIDATGSVEQVRLLSRANRYHERMLVSAAKAWQFEPATKDGQPVRYVLRVRVTL